MEQICDIKAILVCEDIDSHQDYIEIGDRFEEGNVGNEDSWMLLALLF
jgi:hypothetical protein